MSHTLFRVRGDRSKEFPGAPLLPGSSITIDEGIQSEQHNRNCRQLVWLASLGELDPKAINPEKNLPEGINSFSVAAIQELRYLAEYTYEHPENLGDADIYKDFSVLPWFV